MDTQGQYGPHMQVPNSDLLVLTWHLEVSTMYRGHCLTPLCICPYTLTILSPPACCPHQMAINLLMYSRKSSLHSHAFNVILRFSIAPCPGPHFSTDSYRYWKCSQCLLSTGRTGMMPLFLHHQRLAWISTHGGHMEYFPNE